MVEPFCWVLGQRGNGSSDGLRDGVEARMTWVDPLRVPLLPILLIDVLPLRSQIFFLTVQRLLRPKGT